MPSTNLSLEIRSNHYWIKKSWCSLSGKE